MKLMNTLTLTLFITLNLYSIEVGDSVHDFELKELGSDTYFNSKSLDNSVYLLNIWAQWCKGCKEEMPLFNAVAKKYAAQGFKIIAVNIDGKEKKAKKFVKKLESHLGEKSSILFLYDKKKTLAQAYDAKMIPISLLIKEKKVQHIFMGSCKEQQELDVEIEKLLK